MAAKPRSLLNDIQTLNILISMAIIVAIAAVSLCIVSYNMLVDLRSRSIKTADELEALLTYPMYVVDDEQAVRIAKTFLSSGKIAGITLMSEANGLLMEEARVKDSDWIPQIHRYLHWNKLPLGRFSITFSDAEVIYTLTRFGGISLLIIIAVLITHIAVNRFIIANRVNRPFASILQAIRHFGEGDYQTLIEPTPYRDVNILVDQFNDMATRIHLKDQEQKAAEESLRENEEKYRTLFEHAGDAILVLQGDRIVDANTRTIDLLGCSSRDQIIGKKPQDFSPSQQPNGKSSQELASEKISAAMAGQSMFFEWQGLSLDGESFPAEISLNRIEMGGQTLLQAIVRDVSERQRMTEEKASLQHQLLQLQKMEAIGTLAGGIAHDFNNILAGIIGYAELAADETQAGEDKLQKYLRRILEASNRARDLTGQILNFSRQHKTTLHPLVLPPLLKECVKLLESVIPKTISIELSVDTKEDTVLADPTQLHQVIMNLGTNAYQAMRDTGGRMTFKLENVRLDDSRRHRGGVIEPGTYLKLSVSDTGPGIPTNVQDRIFDPYFSTKALDEGTGLGLSVSQGIVNSHNGMIDFEDTSAAGTTFIVLLPATDKDLTLQAPGGQPLTAANQEHILVVDDEPFFLDVLKEILTGVGYRVAAYQDSRKALARLRSEPAAFDLLVSDQTMPKLTGVQLAAEASQLSPHMPIILCTGFSETVTEETAVNYGIDRFLMKPVHRLELIQAVWEVLHPAEDR